MDLRFLYVQLRGHPELLAVHSLSSWEVASIHKTGRGAWPSWGLQTIEFDASKEWTFSTARQVCQASGWFFLRFGVFCTQCDEWTTMLFVSMAWKCDETKQRWQVVYSLYHLYDVLGSMLCVIWRFSIMFNPLPWMSNMTIHTDLTPSPSTRSRWTLMRFLPIHWIVSSMRPLRPLFRTPPTPLSIWLPPPLRIIRSTIWPPRSHCTFFSILLMT